MERSSVPKIALSQLAESHGLLRQALDECRKDDGAGVACDPDMLAAVARLAELTGSIVRAAEQAARDGVGFAARAALGDASAEPAGAGGKEEAVVPAHRLNLAAIRAALVPKERGGGAHPRSTARTPEAAAHRLEALRTVEAEAQAQRAALREKLEAEMSAARAERLAAVDGEAASRRAMLWEALESEASSARAERLAAVEADVEAQRVALLETMERDVLAARTGRLAAVDGEAASRRAMLWEAL